jgi:hypothetical protein
MVSPSSFTVTSQSRGRASASDYRRRSVDFEQLDLEDKLRVRRDDAAGTARTVAKVRADGELGLFDQLHLHHTFVPALDHLREINSGAHPR